MHASSLSADDLPVTAANNIIGTTTVIYSSEMTSTG
jgi:hypothetical protein